MIDIQEIKSEFEKDTATSFDPEQIKHKYFGRKQGIITKAFEDLVALPVEEKRKLGPSLSQLKKEVEQKIGNSQGGNNNAELDLTLPPLEKQIGHLHPLTTVQKELEDIFKSLGFSVIQGPDVESDWYNFTALNFPPDHPARDMQDTFFIKTDKAEKLVMRTHTSPNQIRFMKQNKPPFAIVVPGTVYRNEATDATHEHTFEQLEGLVVGESVNFANMVWAIEALFKKFFGNDAKIKVLPSFFPFVEPGAEVLMSSPKFKNGKWIEMGGCGMVHQNVFAASGYQKNKYQGFAFGIGTARFPLMKNGVTDIRLLRENNLEFLTQF